MALSSTEPVDFPLPRTALVLGFGLLALRASCKREPSGARAGRQGSRTANRAICENFSRQLLRFSLPRPTKYDWPMHLRVPSIDQGVQAFLWAALFFVILWLGMLAVGVSSATALIFSLLAGAVIFLFVRVRGESRPGSS